MIMKAAVYHSFGGTEVLEVVEVPEPKVFADQVRIRIKAAALNPADLGFQAGAVDALVDSFFPVANSNEHPGTIQVFARLDQADLEAIVELAEAGKLSVRVARSFPLDQAADAQRLLAQGHSGGKIVLTVA
jgi:NADPH:quinone reductase-like Zn-dependent oxidoreductase